MRTIHYKYFNICSAWLHFHIPPFNNDCNAFTDNSPSMWHSFLFACSCPGLVLDWSLQPLHAIIPELKHCFVCTLTCFLFCLLAYANKLSSNDIVCHNRCRLRCTQSIIQHLQHWSKWSCRQQKATLAVLQAPNYLTWYTSETVWWRNNSNAETAKCFFSPKKSALTRLSV